MDINKISINKNPKVRIDKSLNERNKKVLFPEKLEKANTMLRTVGLPDFEKLK